LAVMAHPTRDEAETQAGEARGGRLSALIYDPFLWWGERAGMAERRRALVSLARGSVLELGAGTGLNLDHYPDGLDRLVMAEPEPNMVKRLEQRRERLGRRAEIVRAAAEALPFADDSFDTVVSTMVLCTVPDPTRARKATRSRSSGAQWTWQRYAELLPPAQLQLLRTLFDRVAEAISARELAWEPKLRNGHIAFQRFGGYNVVSLDVHPTTIPSVMIKVPLPLEELGITNPYPDLHTFWQPKYKQVGWNIPSTDEIPDLGLAIEITRRYQPAAGVEMQTEPIPVD
jgi:SAM-dependent methyltransferase